MLTSQADYEALLKGSHENLAKVTELDSELKRVVHQKEELIRSLEITKQEKNDIKIETATLISTLKNETLYKENLVDKRVINKFLLSYFDLSTTYSVKLQILETLSSILSFSAEEREKVCYQRIIVIDCDVL